MARKIFFILIGIIIIAVASKKLSTVKEYGPGVIAPDIPVQNSTDAPAFQIDEFLIAPQAEFELEAKVLARENYRLGKESELSPIDLALGWGRMSDESILQHIDISQRNRFYYWTVKEFPIPRREIEQNSANMHLIPADDYVERRIKDVEPGQLIRLKGYLVKITTKDGWRWISSMSRNDTGNGACELIWVEEFDIYDDKDVVVY